MSIAMVASESVFSIATVISVFFATVTSKPLMFTEKILPYTNSFSERDDGSGKTPVYTTTFLTHEDITSSLTSAASSYVTNTWDVFSVTNYTIYGSIKVSNLTGLVVTDQSVRNNSSSWRINESSSISTTSKPFRDQEKMSEFSTVTNGCINSIGILIKNRWVHFLLLPFDINILTWIIVAY